MADLFFTGKTRAGRELRLFYEHTQFDTFRDETGDLVDNPAETIITGTLDGEPLAIQRTTGNERRVAVVTDQGTFTAVSAEGTEDDHTEALRTMMEWRPSGGFDVQLLSSDLVDSEWRFVLSVSTNLLSERVEVRMSEAVARVWANEGSPPPRAEVIERDMRRRLHSWGDVVKAAQQPTTILAGYPLA